MNKILGLSLLAAGLAAGMSSANAGVVFSDNFDSYAPVLNWVPPANWTVAPGSVDLIGDGYFDFFPGHGGYVDLDGSTNQAGTLQTIASFGPGTYTLTFDLAGNARNDVDKTTTISLGNWSKSLDLASNSPYQLYTYTFTTTVAGNLSFADNTVGNQNIGNILDNVTLSAAPEASTWAMMLVGFAGLGFAGYRTTRKSGPVAA
jgi:hypothetical protein